MKRKVFKEESEGEEEEEDVNVDLESEEEEEEEEATPKRQKSEVEVPQVGRRIASASLFSTGPAENHALASDY